MWETIGKTIVAVLGLGMLIWLLLAAWPNLGVRWPGGGDYRANGSGGRPVSAQQSGRIQEFRVEHPFEGQPSQYRCSIVGGVPVADDRGTGWCYDQ